MAERPLWTSHRGYKAAAVENTLAAFRDACALGFASLETDLRTTKDGEIVLHHDPDLRRLAGRDARVVDMTRAELEKVPLTGTSSRLFFFDEFVKEFPACSWTFDVKPETGHETVRALRDWAAAKDAGDWLVANSRFVFWDERHEAAMRACFPAIRCYAREPECWRAGIFMRAGLPGLANVRAERCYALTARIFGVTLCTPAVVRAYHERGARVVAFLPESDDDARDFARSGADEILTNGMIVA